MCRCVFVGKRLSGQIRAAHAHAQVPILLADTDRNLLRLRAVLGATADVNVSTPLGSAVETVSADGASSEDGVGARVIRVWAGELGVDAMELSRSLPPLERWGVVHAATPAVAKPAASSTTAGQAALPQPMWPPVRAFVRPGVERAMSRMSRASELTVTGRQSPTSPRRRQQQLRSWFDELEDEVAVGDDRDF